MKKSIKIALLGSLYSGKTTLATSILSSIVRNLSTVLYAIDESDDSLSHKMYKLIDTFQNKTHVIPFVMQGMPMSAGINNYVLRVGVPGTRKVFRVELIDISGSILQI